MFLYSALYWSMWLGCCVGESFKEREIIWWNLKYGAIMMLNGMEGKKITKKTAPGCASFLLFWVWNRQNKSKSCRRGAFKRSVEILLDAVRSRSRWNVGVFALLCCVYGAGLGRTSGVDVAILAYCKGGSTWAKISCLVGVSPCRGTFYPRQGIKRRKMMFKIHKRRKDFRAKVQRRTPFLFCVRFFFFVFFCYE